MWGDTCGDTRYSNSDDKPANRTLPKPKPSSSGGMSPVPEQTDKSEVPLPTFAVPAALVASILLNLDVVFPDWRDTIRQAARIRKLAAAFPDLAVWDSWSNPQKLEWANSHWSEALEILENDKIAASQNYAIFLTYELYAISALGYDPAPSEFFDEQTVMELWEQAASNGSLPLVIIVLAAAALGPGKDIRGPGAGKGTSTRPPLRVSALRRGELEAMRSSGQIPKKNGLRKAGYSYQEHMGRGQLPKVAGRDLNAAGQDLLDDILDNPNSTLVKTKGGKFAGGWTVFRPDGVGAVFNPESGAFEYFGVGFK